MAQTDVGAEALIEWAKAVEVFTRQVSQLADTMVGQVERIDSELAEVRDEITALSDRVTSVHSQTLRALTDRIGGTR